MANHDKAKATGGNTGECVQGPCVQGVFTHCLAYLFTSTVIIFNHYFYAAS